MYRQVIEKAAEKNEKDDFRLSGGSSGPSAPPRQSAVLERVTVDYYGVQTPLTQMGNITSPEPRMLVINVWDQKAIPDGGKGHFEKRIWASTPPNDGKIIRLVVPELNEERRKELTKLVRKGAEEPKWPFAPSAATPWSSSKSWKRTA